MNKRLSIMSLILGLFVCATMFSACGSSDDDDGGSSNPLVGTWWVEKNGVYTEMTFNKDMSFSWRNYTTNRDVPDDYDTGTYSIVDNVLYTTWQKYSSKPRKFKVEGNKLITDEAGGTTWTRK